MKLIRPRIRRQHFFTRVGALLFIGNTASFGNGIQRNGVGAESMGKAGASVADTRDAFASMTANPGLLGYATAADLGIGLSGAYAEGEYHDSLGETGDLGERSGVFPEFAFRMPVGERWGLGVSLASDFTRVGDWRFQDIPGGPTETASYGVQDHRSEILTVRGAMGLGFRVSEQLSLGGSIGVVYNRNQLKSPYTFQSHPALAGLKTLLDLDADGYGMNADLGLVYTIAEDWTFGLSYHSPTHITTEGSAKGNIGVQLQELGGDFASARPDFKYDAKVKNTLPQSIGTGLAWEATDELRLILQVDWINWEDSFDELNVRLSDGSNADINGLLGTHRLNDDVPLEWEDRLVYRFGVEYQLAEQWILRAGYAYGENPIPSRTLLPTTAAISEQTLGLGVGYRRKNFRIDLAYQYDIPNSESIHGSVIKSGEFNGSKVELEAHWLSISAGFSF